MNGDEPAPGEEKTKGGIWTRLRGLFSKPTSVDPGAGAPAENGGQAVEETAGDARRDMIERVIAFDEKTVVDVMAPRADICAVDIDTPLSELLRAFAEASHSRMPIYRGDLDDPIGMAHIKDVVALIANGSAAGDPQKRVLKDIRRPLLYAPPSMRITDLLLRMQAARVHMALVIDEYGGTDGLVTIEDLVEEIVGEINDEHDEDEAPTLAALADGGWEADARVELIEFAQETGYRLLGEGDDDEIDTLGGYVVSLAGRVPQRGEVVSSPSGFDIEVTEADARKLRKLRIRPISDENNEAAE